VTKVQDEQQVAQPQWARELSVKYSSGIAYAFVLHGNVQDYVAGVPGQTLKNYLLSSFKKRDIALYWNRATGFSFPIADMSTRFAEIVGLQTQPPAMARGSGLAQGLNALANQAPSDISTTLEKVKKPEDALEMISKLLRFKPKGRKGEADFSTAVVIDYAETVAPATDGIPSEADRGALVTLSEWGRDPLIASHDAIIVMIVNDLHDLNERLRKSGSRWEQIAIPFPDFEERAEFAKLLVEDREREVVMDEAFSYSDFSRLTTGLRFIDLEDISLRASFHHQPITRSMVKQRKDEIMASEFEEVLQVVENEFGFEAIGGLEEVKRDAYETIIIPMRNGNLRVVPQGELLMGPAGTGKTKFAKALSKEAGLTFVELQPSKIFSKWVGDTERRLERALTAIKAMIPCIVFIDEVDQAINRGESGDSGVSNRVFKRLMEVMSDTTLRGKVLWVAATNRPDLLDAALLRPGRFDKKVPILAPDSKERASILSVLTKLAFSAELLPTESEYLELAARMENYTGAEIEGIIGKAIQLHARGNLSVIQALVEAYEKIIPTTQNIDAMTRLALMHCNDLDLVPQHLRDLARQVRHPQARRETEEALENDPLTYARRARKRDF